MLLKASSTVLATLKARAASEAPLECCGILLGRAEAAGTRITAATPAANVDSEPSIRFEIDPQALIDAHRAARNGGLTVLGYYHSHPAGPAEPSSVDRALAPGDGKLWAIVGSRGDVAFWRDGDAGFEPLSYYLLQD